MVLKVGVIGCGNMGSGMVSQLLAAGLDVYGFDADKNVRHRIKQLGARTSESVAEMVQQCPFVILSLPTASIVESVVTNACNDFLPEAVVLDTSTSMPATSQAMAALGTQNGFSFIDGPVSGGPKAANAGTMTMLLAGEPAAIARLEPITDIISAKTVFVGESGSGHAAKIANNMLCAANLVLVSEAIRLAEATGVNAKDLLEGVNAGSGRSGVSEVNYPSWVLNDAFDSGFTMGLMRKDVGLALELAKNSGVELKGFPAIADIWLKGSESISDSDDFNRITQLSTQD